MTPPLPILCNSCGYDVTNLANAARGDPTLPCPECGMPISQSLPTPLPTPHQPHTSMLASMARGYLDVYRHPLSVWRRLPVANTTGETSILNALVAGVALAVSGLAHAWINSIEGAMGDVILVLLAGSIAILALTYIIAFIAARFASLKHWRLTNQTFTTVMNHATMLWPSACILSAACLIITDAIFDLSNLPPSLTTPIFVVLLALPPIAVFCATLQGLHALRFANPPQPPPDPSLPSPP